MLSHRHLWWSFCTKFLGVSQLQFMFEWSCFLLMFSLRLIYGFFMFDLFLFQGFFSFMDTESFVTVLMISA